MEFSPRHATRVAVALATFAGLVTIGACADSVGSKSITEPNISIRDFGSGTFANSGVVKLCITASSPNGDYFFDNSFTFQASGGTTFFNTANAPPTSAAYDINKTTSAETCIIVAERTFAASHDADPFSGVQIDQLGPNPINGAVYAGTSCPKDGNDTQIPKANSCGSTTFAFLNWNHGTKVIYSYTVPPSTHNCTYTQGYYKNHENYTQGVMSTGAAPYLDGPPSGQLEIGAYHLTAAQVDGILGTPVGKGYNKDGVVFTKDQLAMIHQLITAELNVGGGAASAGILSTITDANNGYTSASKDQLTSWNDTLDAFNEGRRGVPGWGMRVAIVITVH